MKDMHVRNNASDDTQMAASMAAAAAVNSDLRVSHGSIAVP